MMAKFTKTLALTSKSFYYGGMAGAARDKKWGVVEELFASGADPDSFGNWDQTALFYAIAEKQNQLVALLLTKANPNIMSKNEVWQKNTVETPLHLASRIGNEIAVKLLVINGAKIDSTNQDHKKAQEITSPAIAAVISKYYKIRCQIESLLKKGGHYSKKYDDNFVQLLKEVKKLFSDLSSEDPSIMREKKVDFEKTFYYSVVKLATEKGFDNITLELLSNPELVHSTNPSNKSDEKASTLEKDSVASHNTAGTSGMRHRHLLKPS